MFEVTKNVLQIKKFITKLGVVPSIVDLLTMYYDNNGSIAQVKKQGLIKDPNMYLDDSI